MENDLKNNITESSTEQTEGRPVNINPDTPISIDEFTLSDILDSETIKMGVKAIISFFEQSTKNDNAQIEISKKQLNNQIEIRKLDIKEQELDIKATEQEQKYIKWFDIRNKIYTIGMLILVIVATVLLKYFDILDKSEARVIILFVFGIGMASNTDLIKSIFSGKKED